MNILNKLLELTNWTDKTVILSGDFNINFYNHD